MDTGKLDIKLDYLEGYGDEPYVSFIIPEADIDHLNIWEGLFADLLANPDMSGKGWNGFTRDYHELKGIWNESGEQVSISIPEYLSDLDNYKDRSFNYGETADMLEALYKYLEYAKEHGYKITAKYID